MRKYFRLITLISIILTLILSAMLVFATLRLPQELTWGFYGGYEELEGFDIYLNGELVASDSSTAMLKDTESTAFSSTYEFVTTVDAGAAGYTDPTLCFRSSGASVSVYQDDELIYELTSRQGGYEPASYDGGRYNLMPLDDGMEGESTVRIIFVTSYDSSGHNFYPVFFGNKTALVAGIVAQNSVSLLIALSVITLSVVITLLALILGNKTARSNLISSSALVMITGLWILTQNWSKQLVMDNVTIALDLSYLVMALLPLSMLHYIRKNYDTGLTAAYRVFEHASYGIIALYILMYTLYVFFHIPYDNILFAVSMLLMLHLLSLAAVCTVTWIRNRYDGGPFLITGMILYIFPVVIEQILMGSNQPLQIQLVIYVPFYLAILIFLLRAFAESMKNSHSSEERRKIFSLAYSDSLTGLLNRAALDNRISALGREARRAGTLYIFMFDIDGMKECNDNFGHAAGDRLLVDFAESLRETTTGLNCYIFRYGGDEFLLMVEEDSAFDTQRIITNLRENFRKRNGMGYGFSAGAVRWSASTRQDIISRIRDADSRMYREKNRHKSSHPL